MTIRVTFSNVDLAATCSRSSSLTARWGDAADDIRLALSVLAASAGLNEFESLSPVHREGDLTVFAGMTHDVTLTLSTTPDGDDLCIHHLEVSRAGART